MLRQGGRQKKYFDMWSQEIESKVRFQITNIKSALSVNVIWGNSISTPDKSSRNSGSCSGPMTVAKFDKGGLIQNAVFIKSSICLHVFRGGYSMAKVNVNGKTKAWVFRERYREVEGDVAAAVTV